MGKLRQNDSDNEMDVEPQQVQRIDVETNKVPKKNKKISKTKNTPNSTSKPKSSTSNFSKDVVKQYAKIVNLKKNQRSLTDKQ
jgi:hypothetical protein